MAFMPENTRTKGNVNEILFFLGEFYNAISKLCTTLTSDKELEKK